MKSLQEIKDIYNLLPNDTNEETIKRKVVEQILIYLGYDEDWFRFETRTSTEANRRVDISVLIENDEDRIFFIEVKKKNCNISKSDITQLTNYLNDRNIKWGILTNGNRYILLNNKMDTCSENKIVLEYFLIDTKNMVSKKKNDMNLNFITKDALFETQVTNYLSLLSEFLLGFDNTPKEYNILGSKRQYESSIYAFINYLIKKEQSFNLQYIHLGNFSKFLNELSINKEYSKQTFENKYRYVLAFAKFLENKPHFKNTFRDINLDSILSNSNLKLVIKLENSITEDEIMQLLSYFNSCRYPSRNKIILIMLLYGFDIEDIITLKDSQIDLEKSVIKIKNKTFKITQNLSVLFDEHLNEKKKNKVKIKYTLYTKHDNSYKQLKYNTLNEIINNSFNTINVTDERKKQLNIKSIRASLIKKLYDYEYSLEEICYLTNLNISVIAGYIDEDKIIHNGKKLISKIVKTHPYAALL